MSERVNERASERVNERVSERVSERGTEGLVSRDEAAAVTGVSPTTPPALSPVQVRVCGSRGRQHAPDHEAETPVASKALAGGRTDPGPWTVLPNAVFGVVNLCLIPGGTATGTCRLHATL